MGRALPRRAAAAKGGRRLGRARPAGGAREGEWGRWRRRATLKTGYLVQGSQAGPRPGTRQGSGARLARQRCSNLKGCSAEAERRGQIAGKRKRAQGGGAAQSGWGPWLRVERAGRSASGARARREPRAARPRACSARAAGGRHVGCLLAAAPGRQRPGAAQGPAPGPPGGGRRWCVALTRAAAGGAGCRRRRPRGPLLFRQTPAELRGRPPSTPLQGRHIRAARRPGTPAARRGGRARRRPRGACLAARGGRRQAGVDGSARCGRG